MAETESVDRRNQALAKLQVPSQPGSAARRGGFAAGGARALRLCLLPACSRTQLLWHCRARGTWCAPALPTLKCACSLSLQAANPDLIISYCLPVLPDGLTHNGVALLANAVKWGVKIDTLQLMAMDYGGSAAPNPAGKMGYYAIQVGAGGVGGGGQSTMLRMREVFLSEEGVACWESTPPACWRL